MSWQIGHRSYKKASRDILDGCNSSQEIERCIQNTHYEMCGGENTSRIYIMYSSPYDGHCKIGITRKPNSRTVNIKKNWRLDNLGIEAKLLCCCTRHGLLVERELHRFLWGFHQIDEREWFVLDQYHVEYIKRTFEIAATIPVTRIVKSIDGNDIYYGADPNWIFQVLKALECRS
jgi:hypothetical protein